MPVMSKDKYGPLIDLMHEHGITAVPRAEDLVTALGAGLAEHYRRQDLVYRLRKRAEIRRQISTRKSVQNNEPDRLADLLDEAAAEIERLAAL